MKHLLIIIILLLNSVSWSKEEIYVCQPIAQTSIDEDYAYGEHIRMRDNTLHRTEKPKLLKIKKDDDTNIPVKVTFGNWDLNLTNRSNIFTYVSDIFHFYATGPDSSTRVLMYYYVNANNSRETFRQESTMYYCDKS